MKDAQVQIINMAGKIVQFQNLENGKNASLIDVENLPIGFYLVKIFDAQNRVSFKKLIISR